MTTKRRPATQCPHKRQCTSKECRDCKEGLGSNDNFTAKAKKPKKVTGHLTPQAFHELDVTKKIHVLALTYMNRCCIEGFTSKGLFAIKGYLRKIEPSYYQVFYDWLWSLEDVTPCSLYDIYGKSTAHQLNLRLNSGGTVDVPEYQSLLQCLNEL